MIPKEIKYNLHYVDVRGDSYECSQYVCMEKWDGRFWRESTTYVFLLFFFFFFVVVFLYRN